MVMPIKRVAELNNNHFLAESVKNQVEQVQSINKIFK